MITQDELNAVKLSATKKDFYQIWNELLETASKISERWDPQNTNESDPGIVLLKVLTAVADKLNYNVDVNALEAFMPSAAQEESMRKLTEMLGYNMKYYRSATTDVQISFNKKDVALSQLSEIPIDQFTNIKDIDDTINYVTIEEIRLNADMPSQIVSCIEGELVECETDDDNIISLLQLDDNNRYYLPEVQIAENGIFVTNIDNNTESRKWEQVYNLNTQPIGKLCYKFGFDSRVNLPYIQFPDDISNIIEDGLKVKYIRTSGINGNVSPRTLCKLEKPISWQSINNEADSDWLNPENYTVSNPSAARNGCNRETLTDAYNGYKKIVGTFDTLVTCRDYMNKIYQMTNSEVDTTPLVSNIIVSDIRDDINHANVLCTMGDYGIEYNNVAKEINFDNLEIITDTVWNTTYVGKARAEHLGKTYKVVSAQDSNIVKGYFQCVETGTGYDFVTINTKELNNFDLVLYPFKTVYGLNTKGEYTRSFKYDDSTLLDIKEQLENYKTLSHNLVTPASNDIACIKNYYNLKSSITTTRKVNAIEQANILNNIYTKLYETFNMRKVDFGEKLIDDVIHETIETADPRIKKASWEDPEIVTKFCTVAGGEFGFSNSEQQAGNKYYNDLVLNNVLAGRIPLFNYDENFKPEYNEVPYPTWLDGSSSEEYDLLYPESINEAKTNGIKEIKTLYSVDALATNIKLQPNEVIQFRLPNLKTDKTYPAYVNYFIHLNTNLSNKKAVPATMYTLADFLDADTTHGRWNRAAALFNNLPFYTPTSEDAFNQFKVSKHALFTFADNTYTYADTYTENTRYYYLELTEDNLATWQRWLATEEPVNTLKFYYNKGINLNASYGYLVDKNHRQFLELTTWRGSNDPFKVYFVPHTWDEDYQEGQVEDWHVQNGLGQNADINGIPANTEYQLKHGEYILFNYTHAESTEGDNKTVVNECFKEGSIIKANFELKDSIEHRSLHKYTKTDGYDFTNYNIQNPEGMFTLGTNEQIEKRSFVEVKLDTFANIYWEVKNEMIDENDRIYFPWDEEQDGTVNNEPFYTAYTLKDGEYLYYTNRDKTNIAYYGSGTKIKRTKNTPQIYKTRFDATISAEDVATLGISTAIPWRSYDLTPDGDNKKELTLTEYQYINLAAGSILKDIEVEKDKINNDWQNCNEATYSLPESDTVNTLSKVSFTDENTKWQVRSKLELNMGPTVVQQLYEDTGKNIFDQITLVFNDAQEPVDIRPHNGITVSVKANKIIQSTTSGTPVGYINILDTDTVATYYDCQVKVFNLETLKDADNNTINLNNFGEGNFTKLSFNSTDRVDGTRAFALINATIPNGHFGLLTIQNNKIGASTNNVAIRLIKASGAEAGQPGMPLIYNAGSEWPYYITSDAELWATESACYNNFKDDGASDEVATSRFNSLKSTLYTRVSSNEPPASKELHSYAITSSGPIYYEYTPVASDATYNRNYIYCQLLDEGGTDTLYQLAKGINVIKLTESCTVQIFPDSAKRDTILFGNLDLIYSDNPINPKLKYKAIDMPTVEAQILKDIKALDPNNKFYYNAIINNETALDLNPLDPDDTMENPNIWYSYNNINNKFVVSEINADYLPTGITISKNSKL